MSRKLLARAACSTLYSAGSTTDYGVNFLFEMVRAKEAAEAGESMVVRVQRGLKCIRNPVFFHNQAALFAAPGLAMPLHGADEENFALVAAQPLFYYHFLGSCGALLQEWGLKKELEVMVTPIWPSIQT